jgi:hypothetical protein
MSSANFQRLEMKEAAATQGLLQFTRRRGDDPENGWAPLGPISRIGIGERKLAGSQNGSALTSDGG